MATAPDHNAPSSSDVARPRETQQSAPPHASSGIGFSRGVAFALVAAALFGASTPLAKILLGHVDPVLLAGLLYGGSGCGVALVWSLRSWLAGQRAREASLKQHDVPWLAGAILAGGVIAPVLLLIGLTSTPASTASLLLTLEGVGTALLAWGVFHEHFDRRLVWGMIAITAGSLLLSRSGQPDWSVTWGMVAIVGACFAWAVDNNLTRKVSAGDPLQIAGAKGIVAGTVNLTIAWMTDATAPSVFTMLTAAAVGLLGYGLSLICFILALRHLGTARTSAYFAAAPFIGAALAVLVLGDRLTTQFVIAMVLMGSGVWVHVTEHHEHRHWHVPLEHDHWHSHDTHHAHGHGTASHSHVHTHVGMMHAHPHYPDLHHRHSH